MRRALVLSVLLFVLSGCESTGAGGATLSPTAPFGLTEVDMPNTEADIVAAIQSMPPVIAGRRRAGPGAISASYGEEGIMWHIGALPENDPVVAMRGMSAAEWVAHQAEHRELGEVRESDLALDGELVWFVSEDFLENLGAPPEYSGTIYVMAWAHPHGSWSFYVQTTTMEGLREMVQDFALAVAG